MPELHQYSLHIAGIRLRIVTDQPLEMEKEFVPFLDSAGEPDFIGEFRQVQQLPHIPEEVLCEDSCYRVHPAGLRSFFDAPREFDPYAVAVYDDALPGIRVSYLEKGKHCVSEIHNSFFHLGFESLLIRKDRLCLHAACVKTEMGGLLFSGPSGIGKSTQAALWSRYRGAKQINGDRPILSKAEDGWLAWGAPYAGSSRCHVNESCPVKAIVMLKQGTECSVRKLRLPEAFRAVWSGLTMHSWDEASVVTASGLAMELIAAVPVYELCCTPDEQAVIHLEQALGKDGCL